MRQRTATATALLAGVLVMAAARIAVPSAPPLYDGVVVIPPYNWVDPPPGLQGGAQGATASLRVRGGGRPTSSLWRRPRWRHRHRSLRSPVS